MNTVFFRETGAMFVPEDGSNKIMCKNLRQVALCFWIDLEKQDFCIFFRGATGYF